MKILLHLGWEKYIKVHFLNARDDVDDINRFENIKSGSILFGQL